MSFLLIHSGLVLGTGMGMIATEGDWDQSLQLGLYSGLMGLSFGALSGFVEGYLQDLSNLKQQNPEQITNDDINTSIHASERMSERSVSSSSIQDALNNPLDKRPGKATEFGPSVKYIGEDATVIINPITSKIITVFPTSTQRRNILKNKLTL